VTTSVDNLYKEKREKYSAEVMNQVEKSILLRTLDRLWRDHIITIDQLRQVIYLRSYGQRDPLNEYKTEAFNLFQSLVAGLKEQATSQLMRVEIQFQDPGADDLLPDEDELPEMEAFHLDATTGENDAGGDLAVLSPPAKPARKASAKAPKLNPKDPATWGKVARNDMCPCGSGKRYKHCHGAFI
jgi:preprotein translocase subunit SecA